MAKEIEAPFGFDDNDLPMSTLNNEFNVRIKSLLHHSKQPEVFDADLRTLCISPALQHPKLWEDDLSQQFEQNLRAHLRPGEAQVPAVPGLAALPNFHAPRTAVPTIGGSASALGDVEGVAEAQVMTSRTAHAMLPTGAPRPASPSKRPAFVPSLALDELRIASVGGEVELVRPRVEQAPPPKAASPSIFQRRGKGRPAPDDTAGAHESYASAAPLPMHTMFDTHLGPSGSPLWSGSPPLAPAPAQHLRPPGMMAPAARAAWPHSQATAPQFGSDVPLDQQGPPWSMTPLRVDGDGIGAGFRELGQAPVQWVRWACPGSLPVLVVSGCVFCGGPSKHKRTMAN